MKQTQSPRVKHGRILAIAIPLLALGTVLVGWLGSHTRNEIVKGDLQVVRPADMSAQVKAVRVSRGELPIAFKALGVVVARQQSPTSVVSRISSTVTAVEVLEGQNVEAGTVLVRLDDRLARSTRTRAQSALSAAETELRRADEGGLDMQQSDLDLAAKSMEAAALVAVQEATRMATLLPRGAASEKEAIAARKQEGDAAREAKSASDKARLFRSSGRELERSLLVAAVQKARADLTDAEVSLEFTVLRAPISGLVTGLKARVGSPVPEGTEIAQVLGKTSTGLCLWVTSENANHVFKGAGVTCLRDDGRDPYQGTVISVGRQLDPATGLVPIEVALEDGVPDPPRLGENIFADVTTQVNGEGLLVPDSAIVMRNGQPLVYSLNLEHIAHPLPVHVVVRAHGAAIITAENLNEGDFVIVDGNYNLPDGARVVAATSP